MTIADQMGLNKSNLLQVILQELLDAHRDVELITIASISWIFFLSSVKQNKLICSVWTSNEQVALRRSDQSLPNKDSFLHDDRGREGINLSDGQKQLGDLQRCR